MNAPLPPTAVEFTRRWRLLAVLTGLTIVPMMIAEAVGRSLLPSGFDYLLVVVTGLLTAVAYGVFFSRNWRCPACGNVPSRHWHPRFCGHCGAQLLALPASPPGAPPEDPRETWRREEAQWDKAAILWRKSELGFLGALLIVGALFVGVILPLAGTYPGRELRLLVGAAVCLAAGLAVLRGFRVSLEEMGLEPAEIRQRMGGQCLGSGMLLILIAAGGLLWLREAVVPVELADLLGTRVETVPNALPLALTFTAFGIAGLFLMAAGWRRVRTPYASKL